MINMLEDKYDGTLGVDHAVVYKLDSLNNALSADPLICFLIPQPAAADEDGEHEAVAGLEVTHDERDERQVRAPL